MLSLLLMGSRVAIAAGVIRLRANVAEVSHHVR